MIKLTKSSLNWHSLSSRIFSLSNGAKNSGTDTVGLRLGLLWASAAVCIAGLLFGFDLIGQALESVLTVLFEYIQENLESFYRKSFKLDLYHAQMATAYTGFLVFIGLAFFLLRKFSVVYQECQVSWRKEREKFLELWFKHCENIKVWWNGLDQFNKFFATIALVVLAIPVVSIVCFALGKVVAELV